jgi:hypothetical protein
MVNISQMLVTGYSIVLSMAITFRVTVLCEKVFFSHLGKAGISKFTGGGFDPDTVTALQLTGIEILTSVVLGAIFFEQIFSFVNSHFFWIGHVFIFGSAFSLIYSMRLSAFSDSSDSAVMKWKVASVLLFVIALTMTDFANSYLEIYDIFASEPSMNSTINATNSTG